MSVGARTWKVVKPHIPLIKFRKGGKESGQAINQKHLQSLNSGSSRAVNQKGSVIDDTQLPARYSRKPLSQAEMETIERGGPE